MIHLVFESSLSSAIKAALEKKEISVSGTDSTLEQFKVAAAAGHIQAGIAIVNVVAGIVSKEDSLKQLKEIRTHLPDLRMIVILPIHADRQWITEIGRLGIYDIHPIEQFSIDDVVGWLSEKMTIADVLSDDTAVTGKVKPTQPKLADAKTQVVVNTVERIVGSVTIGVAAVTSRSGSTLTSLSIASYLSQRFKVALIECAGVSLNVYQTYEISKIVSSGFRLNDIDVFISQSKELWVNVLAAGYDYVVMDFGDLSDEQEFMRCTSRFLISGSSQWDIESMYTRLGVLMNKYSSNWQIIINPATEERYRSIYNEMSSKERRDLKLKLFRQGLLADPLQRMDYSHWLEEVLPREKISTSLLDGLLRKLKLKS